jgi:4-alpha-glucanotransferase
LAFLASSHARVLLVNLEDLWLETDPQNIPGIQEEHPNWRRKARYSLEVFSQMPDVLDAIEEMDRIFKQGKEF